MTRERRPFETGWDPTAFVGGRPALDFLNTVSDHGKTREESRIADWPAFLGWSSASGAFTDAELRALTELDKASARAALAELHALRETAYPVLSALAAGAAPAAEEADRLEARMKDALARAVLTTRDGGYAWSADRGVRSWPVDSLALSLESLMRDPELRRLRQCGRCTWLFVDRGRGAGRRWCAMSTCGNRAKAEAFRRR